MSFFEGEPLSYIYIYIHQYASFFKTYHHHKSNTIIVFGFSSITVEAYEVRRLEDSFVLFGDQLFGGRRISEIPDLEAIRIASAAGRERRSERRIEMGTSSVENSH